MIKIRSVYKERDTEHVFRVYYADHMVGLPTLLFIITSKRVFRPYTTQYHRDQQFGVM